MRITKPLLGTLSALALVGGLAGCSGGNGDKPAEGTAESGSTSSSSGDGEMEIIMISKQYQNQFYQAAFKGAEDAAKELGVKLTTNGPDAESNISQQVEQLQAAVNQKPAAICLAASDPNAVQDVLASAKAAGIPVIGFDSGVPGDASGAVLATAMTDNAAAGGNVANNLLANPDVQAAIEKGTEAAPAVVAILAQDATSGSIAPRVDGFVEAAVTDIEALPGMKGAVEVSGQEKWNAPSQSPAKVKINVVVPPTTSQADIQAAATTALNTEGLVAIFAANQDGVNALISATADGTELDRENGKFKNIYVVGFDAGASQKTAVASGAFLGSVSQDPYQMGYQAVQMAVAAANGDAVEDADTGSVWYDKSNINDEKVSILLYD